jgi:hypothetical protein
VAASGKITDDKTRFSLFYYLARNSSTVLWALVSLTLYHHATNVMSLILLSHWVRFLQPFLRRRLPNPPVPLPCLPRRQVSIPFAFPATYLLISSYMLRMLFVSLLLGLARLVGFVLVDNPLLERQPPEAPPEPAPDPHNFLPMHTRGRAPAKRLLHLRLLHTLATSDATPALNLKSERVLKQDLQKYHSASGFVTKMSSI